jgi:hypothetical protein
VEIKPTQHKSKSKDLPTKTIKIGDIVEYGKPRGNGKEILGVISGDHLSPGGVQGHLLVTFIFPVCGLESVESVPLIDIRIHQAWIPISELKLFPLAAEITVQSKDEFDDDLDFCRGYFDWDHVDYLPWTSKEEE